LQVQDKTIRIYITSNKRF